MNTTINIPEPLREKPEIGTRYYSPLIAYGRAETICNVWDDDRIDEDRFSYGLCHLDRGSAKQHAKALLSLTARATPSTPSADVGLNHHRTKVDRLEKALAVAWVEQCLPRDHVNFGKGLLQTISGRCNVTDDERRLVATAIQWLGTNCGRAFLIEAFQDAGYALVIRKNKTMSE